MCVLILNIEIFSGFLFTDNVDINIHKIFQGLHRDKLRKHPLSQKMLTILSDISG